MSRIARADVAGIVVPNEVSEEILKGIAETSMIQSLAKPLPMVSNVHTFTEADVTGANAFWVGEGARKQTDAPPMSQKVWTITAAEMAVIIPINENVADDAETDLFELYKPAIETAFANKLDTAAIFGQDAPTAWGAVATGVHLLPDAELAGHVFEEAVTATDAELLDLINGTGAVPGTPDGALQALEEDLYNPTLILAYTRFKARLRNLKDADGRFIFGDAGGNRAPTVISDVPVQYTTTQQGSGVWVPLSAHMIVGDWQQATIGTRAGLSYKAFDQGTITDGAGQVLYSLMEQDMVALRVTARYGFKIFCDDSANSETITSGDEFPFAAVRPYTA